VIFFYIRIVLKNANLNKGEKRMSKHVDDLIQKSIDIPREKFIVEYVHESNKLKEQITELEKENAILKKSIGIN
jgi:hypothetical protein